jgi:sodium pump decarboxylase gamma subunit
MKKFLALICMITCIFGLTACGSSEELTQYEMEKIAYAEQIATQAAIPFLAEANIDDYTVYTAEEIEYVVGQSFGMNVKGNAIISAITSFDTALENIGAITAMGEASAVIDCKTIIVNVPVTGELKSANAELIFSNDMFMFLESAALNEESSFGDSMKKAGLNTLIGMGVVFAVLILISFIISLFGYIPKIQAALDKKKAAASEAPKVAPAPVAPAPVVEEVVDYSDDLELVAVIAAALAAYEGETSTDGFVVRSIRKVNKRR